MKLENMKYWYMYIKGDTVRLSGLFTTLHIPYSFHYCISKLTVFVISTVHMINVDFAGDILNYLSGDATFD